MRYLSLLMIASTILLTTCHQDQITSLNATVVDKKTGAPIIGAKVVVNVYEDFTKGITTSYNIKTDSNGNFYYESEKRFYVYSISASGYVPIGQGSSTPHIELGNVNNITIEVTPFDGVLKLNFLNTSGLYDTMYVAAYSRIQDLAYNMSHGFIFGYSAFVHGPTPKSKTSLLASGEFLHIYCDPKPITQITASQALFHDSVYTLEHDTTFFTVVY